MPEYRPITEDIKIRIYKTLGEDCVSRDPEIIEAFSRDKSDLVYTPEMVITPHTTEQVSRLLYLANEHRFPITPRGGGTGLAGGALAVHGGVILSLASMNQIRSIDTRDLIAQVEPGVITEHLRDAAREKGLFYPPDPASLDTATIGGNAATNAGGPACVKYGTTKDYILGLEVVLPSGKVIRTGVNTRKGVVGYDMTHLIVGSEGTLGIITGLTLKLIPHPPATASLAAVFPDLHTAVRAVTEIMVRGYLPSAVEFMDYKCLRIIKDLLPFDVPGDQASLLLAETDGMPEQTEKEILRIGDICRELGATELYPAPDAESRDQLWEARRHISLRIHDYAGIYLSEDVVVPIGKIADLVDALPKIEHDHRLEIFSFGHAGDGNIHLNFTAPHQNQMNAMEKGIRKTLSKVLEMGGTISGEHGIGIAKQPFISMELPEESIFLQKGIKKLFDPNMILNPGKIFNWTHSA